MQLNKSGIVSLVLGIVLLGLAWNYGFGQDAAKMAVTGLVLGGISWLGLGLLVLGLLILLI